MEELFIAKFLPMDFALLAMLHLVSLFGSCGLWWVIRGKQPAASDRNGEFAINLLLTFAFAASAVLNALVIAAALTHPDELKAYYLIQVIVNLLDVQATSFAELVVGVVLAFVIPLLLFVLPLVTAPLFFRARIVQMLPSARNELFVWIGLGVAFALSLTRLPWLDAVTLFNAAGALAAFGATIAHRMAATRDAPAQP